jgi:Ca2+-binding EF-hand superfamily protein
LVPASASFVHDQALAALPERVRNEISKLGAIKEEAFTDAATQWVEGQFSKYDKNGDQQLTPDEIASMLVKPNGADTNGDGIVTIQEYAKFRKEKQ